MAKYVSENGIKAIRDWTKERDNKSLYNLGYYDTYDASTNTITRQTGYIILDGVKYKFNRIFSSGERGLFSFELTNLNISKPANNGIVGDIICNRFGTYSVNYLRNNNKYGIGVDDGGGIVVCLTKSVPTLGDANAYLVKNPISIQYKLPTNETSYIYKNLANNGRIYPNQYNVNKTYKSELTENGYKLTFTASATEENPSWDAFLVDFDKTEKYESLTVRFEVIKSDVPLNYCLFQFNDWGESEAENTDALIQHYFSIGNRTGIITETFTVNKDLTKGLGSIGLSFDRTPGAGNVEILIKEISLNKKNGSSSYIATPEKVEENHFARYNERFILDHNKSEAERSANLYSGVQTCSGSDTKTYFDARINFFNNSTLISTIWFNKQIKTAYTLVTFTFTKPTNANRMKFGHGGSTKDVEIDYDISNLPNGNYSLSFVVMDNNGTQSFNKIMLNEGSTALPYQPYEGKVVHEKGLESYAKKSELPQNQDDGWGTRVDLDYSEIPNTYGHRQLDIDSYGFYGNVYILIDDGAIGETIEIYSSKMLITMGATLNWLFKTDNTSRVEVVGLGSNVDECYIDLEIKSNCVFIRVSYSGNCAIVDIWSEM